ncbi:MAG TPA: hypothetical protein ENO21_01845, partial [Firmicutes bacterium]|nr:hypothetical protein [Bacillota bacterium]
MRISLGAITALLTAAVVLPALAASTNLFLQDDFDSGERFFFEGTLEERNFRYVDGEYEIDTTGSEDYGQSIMLGDMAEYMVQADARLVITNDDNGGGYGLAFNYREGEEHNDFMLFLVYDRGAFAVLRYLGGSTEVITAPQRTGLLRPLAMNTIAVDVVKGAYSCLINGEQVAQGKDETLTNGGAGLFGTARSIVRFDDFQVFADPPPEPVTDGFDGEIRLHNGEWQGVEFSYAGGQYVIDTTGAQHYGLAPFPGAAGDFEFAADVELVGGTAQGGYGLYARDAVT